MKYRVRHETAYSYGTPVDLAAHLVHMSPRPLPHQRIVSASMEADPTPVRITEGTDYFGNDVRWMFLDKPHAEFDVVLDATVDVAFPPPPPDDATPAWEDVARMASPAGGPGWQAAEFVFDSRLAPAVHAARDYAAPTFTEGRPILAALRELNHRIRTEFAFRPGVTTIATPVSTVLRQRAGVCQDFAHLMISALRALGLPARYVSGYIRTRPPPGQARRRGCDQSHAWVGAWLGPEHGWVDFDPTNDLIVSDEHVILGWGRDYADVSPVLGVLLGGGEHSVAVSVDLESE